MRCISFLWLWGPHILRKQSWLPIISRMFHRLKQDVARQPSFGQIFGQWELFKTAFVERFFLREMREAKVEEFINLKKGSMTVMEYSMNFVKLSRHATSLVSNRRDEMRRFLIRINGDL